LLRIPNGLRKDSLRNAGSYLPTDRNCTPEIELVIWIQKHLQYKFHWLHSGLPTNQNRRFTNQIESSNRPIRCFHRCDSSDVVDCNQQARA
jgi:hypothetical protein